MIVYCGCLSEDQGLSRLRPQWEELRPLSLVPPRHGSTTLTCQQSREAAVIGTSDSISISNHDLSKALSDFHVCY